MRNLRNVPRRGSHLPVLMKLFPMTTGPILELGYGVYSTIYLHWACYVTKRRLVTYEDNPDFYRFALQFRSDYHEVYCISDWDAIDISEPWSIAFIDHGAKAPNGRTFRRYIEISRLTHAQYVVAHDAENSSARNYKYHRIYPLFKYKYKYGGASPHTVVLSNTHDLSEFTV